MITFVLFLLLLVVALVAYVKWDAIVEWFRNLPSITGGPGAPPPHVAIALFLLGVLVLGGSAGAQNPQCPPYSAVVEAAAQSGYTPQVSWTDGDGDRFVVLANKARKVVVLVVYSANGMACPINGGENFTIEKKRNEV